MNKSYTYEDYPVEPALIEEEQHPCLVAEDGSLILGRSRDVHSDYGESGLMRIGSLAEDISKWDLSTSIPVRMDAAQPLNITIVGTRGSGKSNTLGVIAEEMMTSGTVHSPVIVDTLGAFVGIGQARDDKSTEPSSESSEYSPAGFPSNVFRAGRKAGEGTGVRALRISLSQIKAEDLEYVLQASSGQQRALLALASRAIHRGYTRQDGKRTKPKPDFFNLEDLRKWLYHAMPPNDQDAVFTASTRRSILRRIAYAEESGLFARSPQEAVGVEELCTPGSITVIDLGSPSLHTNLKAVIVGWLARGILRLRLQQVNDAHNSVPGTALMVDESQLYVPASGNTAATPELVSFAKCGRKAGCSLILATQQPSATSSTVLSQADICIAHRLVFEADIRTLRKVAPADIPDKLLGDGFARIRGMSAGQALIIDKLLQERPVLADIRERRSQHTGSTLLAPISNGQPYLESINAAEWQSQDVGGPQDSSNNFEPDDDPGIETANPSREHKPHNEELSRVEDTKFNKKETQKMNTAKHCKSKHELFKFTRCVLTWTVVGFLGCMFWRSGVWQKVQAYSPWGVERPNQQHKESVAKSFSPQQGATEQAPTFQSSTSNLDTQGKDSSAVTKKSTIAPNNTSGSQNTRADETASSIHGKSADDKDTGEPVENTSPSSTWAKQHDAELQRQIKIADELLGAGRYSGGSVR